MELQGFMVHSFEEDGLAWVGIAVSLVCMCVF